MHNRSLLSDHIFDEGIALFNRLIPIAGKQTNIAVWCPRSKLHEDTVQSKKNIKYYLRYTGSAKKVNELVPIDQIEPLKICILFPGFNGGPFDLSHVAEMLASQGYWVIAPGCYVDPNLSSSSTNALVSQALAQVYPNYVDILNEYVFKLFSGRQIEDIVYISFSSGIYPFLKSIDHPVIKKIRHRMILIAPGLAKIVRSSISVNYLDSLLLIHSNEDSYPKFGSPLTYMNKFEKTEKTLMLLDNGLHFDFVNLPSDQYGHTKNDVSSYQAIVKRQCIESINHYLDKEVEYEY